MEADEIHEFTEQVEKGGESNLRSVSLIICALAAFVAMVTVIGHRTHTEAVLSQAKASDIWNEYQAKHIRERTDADTAVILSLVANSDPAAVSAKIQDLKTQTAKSKDDQKEAQDKARELDEKVEHAELKATRFDLSEPLLQIAVVLCTVTLLTRQKIYVTLGVILGIAGFCVAASAFFIH